MRWLGERLVLAVAVLSCICRAHSSEESQNRRADIGFAGLFDDSLGEVSPASCTASKIALNGTFVIQSTAQYRVAGTAVNSWLDAFWKIHTIESRNGTLCYHTRKLLTGYRNESIKRQTVAPGELFMETSPPRKCAAAGLCNMMGPNDNNFAVTYRMRDDTSKKFRYSLMTDTELHLDFDIDTLNVIGARQFQDHFAKLGDFRKGGGTHLMCEAGKGLAAGECNGDLYGVVFERGMSNGIDLYRLRQGTPDKRELVAHVPVPFIPGSMHSFAMTKEWAILPLQPFTIDSKEMLLGKDLLHSVKAVPSNQTSLYLVNLASGEIRRATFDGQLFYVHVVNSWQNATHLLFDAAAYDDLPFGFGVNGGVLAALLDPATRDKSNNTQNIRRYTIDLATLTVSEEPLTKGVAAVDFPKVNPTRHGLSYCVYYAVEWRHNKRNYGSWALRKHNICTNEVAFYYKPSSYLSEPIFVPSDQSTTEDGGQVLTIRTDGVTNTSWFVVLDAESMKVLDEYKLPYKVGWFGHGAFYPHVSF